MQQNPKDSQYLYATKKNRMKCVVFGKHHVI